MNFVLCHIYIYTFYLYLYDITHVTHISFMSGNNNSAAPTRIRPVKCGIWNFIEQPMNRRAEHFWELLKTMVVNGLQKDFYRLNWKARMLCFITEAKLIHCCISSGLLYQIGGVWGFAWWIPTNMGIVKGDIVYSGFQLVTSYPGLEPF